MSSAPQLVLCDVSVHAAPRPLIAQLTWQCAPGERWALLGPNGAGKSTLLRTLTGLQAPAAGQITLAGQALATYAPRELAQLRAWCPQFWHDPFSVPVRDAVLATALALVDDPAEAARRCAASLTRWDLDSLAQRDICALSGGERQRVALACCWAQNAGLLLLDEPCAHLDWAHQRLLSEALLAHSAAGGSVVIALHDLNLAWSLATHVLLLDGRGGWQAGPRASVMQQAELSAAYGTAIAVQETADMRWFRLAF